VEEKSQMVNNIKTPFQSFTLLLSAVLLMSLLMGFIQPAAVLASTPPAADATATATVPATATPAPAATATTAPTVQAAAKPAGDAVFSLTILHTNDIHAHHASSNGDGGAAIAASVINQVRTANPNTILLNAGDNFTGTLYYVMYHGIDSAKLMNAMKYDAMTLGNHEFDDGDGNLALFINQLKFPVVAANVNFDKSTALKGKVTPYVILKKSGEKIGVIGLANPETPSMSRPGKDLVFDKDLAKIVQAAVDQLTAASVNKIIVLSHIGYDADLKLAQSVSGVDIIVGGHTHTLLANYDKRATGPYPAEIKDTAGNKVLVVQAGEYLQYIGKLDVKFDASGNVVSSSGDTIYLSQYIVPNPQIAALVKQLDGPIAALKAKVVGQSAVYLEGDRKVCRTQECNLGNLITDAMRAETGVQVAIENGGGIRASIKEGKISTGDILTVLPFGNLVSTFKLSGKDLTAALENGVSQISDGAGRFPQVSGLRFAFDAKQPAGSRIISVEVMDAQGTYQKLDPDTIYTVASNDFMREGGDGYTMFSEKATDVYDYGRPLDEVLTNYIKAHSPVNIAVEGRITAK
jgi:5'-nucleotidase / UDP-sugar diphosphatase